MIDKELIAWSMMIFLEKFQIKANNFAENYLQCSKQEFKTFRYVIYMKITMLRELSIFFLEVFMAFSCWVSPGNCIYFFNFGQI